MKYNRGFTLAELLIVLGIMGVLSTVAIITFKPYDKGIKYIHSNTFYALNKAYYNAMNYYVQEDTDNRNPFKDNISDGTKRMCQALVHYINVVDANSCSATPVSASAISSGNFATETPQFVAVNGVRYYISERLGSHDTTESGQRGVYFYLIFADLNGTRHPNSGNYTPAGSAHHESIKDPDVFTFAAFDGYEDDDNAAISTDARLIPVGISEFEQRYMPTRVIYTDYNDDAYIKYSKGSQPYYISKCEAWGYYNNANNNKDNSGEIYSDPDPKKIRFLSGDVHTFNDYVRAQLADTSKYANSFILSNVTKWAAAHAALYELSSFSPTGNSCSKPVRGVQGGYSGNDDYKCGIGDTYADACSVVIDKYVY